MSKSDKSTGTLLWLSMWITAMFVFYSHSLIDLITNIYSKETS